MKRFVTDAIVLTRINFKEADRIITVLTPDHGKLRLIAKGVRRIKSKIAGGIELFGISSITVVSGRGEINTLISSRLIKHFDNIAKDIDRAMLGYKLLKRLHQATEDVVGEEYFEIIKNTLMGLNDYAVDIKMVELWFYVQMLKATGHSPDLKIDVQGRQLVESDKYTFDFSVMTFRKSSTGSYEGNHIKLLRLCYVAVSPVPLKQIRDASETIRETLGLVASIYNEFI